MTFKKLFSIFCLMLAVISTNISAQDVPSLGPAPYVDNTNIQPPVFNSAIGTRDWLYLSSSPTFQFGKGFLNACTQTNIGAPFTVGFPCGLVNKQGTIYMANQISPFQMYTIDTTTGTHTFLFNCTNVPLGNLAGLTWDNTTNTMFGVGTSITQSQIFTVNMTTGACTLIGSPSSVCAGAIDIACAPNGSLFSTDIVADNLYKWDRVTGVATLRGPLGGNTNFGQDMQFDYNDGKLYGCLYVTGPELHIIDTTTGSIGAILCTYTAQMTGIAMANPPAAPSNPSATICRNGLNINVPDATGSINDTMRTPGIWGCTILDVNCKIDTFTHTWDSDMGFTLSHGAASVLIVNHVGGSGDNFIGTLLNDSASTPIASGTSPFTGSFQPSSPLSAFNTLSTNGDWILNMADNAAGDLGVMKAWCLTITYSCPVGGIQTVEVPNSYKLNQNYPNPFNPTTTISYGLPKSGNVSLVVYDILGREVKTLVNEFKNQGTYNVSFDASSLASGVYFYTLKANDFTSTKKMLLVK